MTPDRSGHKVLIIADDPLLAALIGSLVESARGTPAFAAPAEVADQAVARVKPLAAVLLDAGAAVAESDLFVSRARKLGARVLVFGTRTMVARRADWARTHSLETFALPDAVEALAQALERLNGEPRRPRSDADRRATERRPDGTLVFTDAAGTRWSVYDRRGTERRERVDRRFVNEAGEVRHCEISEQEAGVVTASALAAQLDRAIAE